MYRLLKNGSLSQIICEKSPRKRLCPVPDAGDAQAVCSRQGGVCLGKNLFNYRRNRLSGAHGCKTISRAAKKVVGLRLPGDKAHLLPDMEYEIGDITKPYTLQSFFQWADGKEAVVIHCAGLVTVLPKMIRCGR